MKLGLFDEWKASGSDKDFEYWLCAELNKARAALAASAPVADANGLLPCPFCGADGWVDEITHNRYAIGCNNDCASMPHSGFFTSRDNAIKSWNTRALSKPAAPVAGEGKLLRLKNAWNDYLNKNPNQLRGLEWDIAHNAFLSGYEAADKGR